MYVHVTYYIRAAFSRYITPGNWFIADGRTTAAAATTGCSGWRYYDNATLIYFYFLLGVSGGVLLNRVNTANVYNITYTINNTWRLKQ